MPGRTSCRNRGRSGNQAAPRAASWSFAEDFAAEPDGAADARVEAGELGVTPVSRGAASLLTVLAKSIGARAVVEIGTGGGVSGLAFFAGMGEQGILTSVDPEQDHQTAARNAFTSAGIANRRFRLIAGAALDVLPRLTDRGYDLVLIDADKVEYTEYLEQALRLVRPGGAIVVDNSLWHDRVADPAATDPETQAIRDLLEQVGAAERLVPALLPVGDGLLVATRRD